MTYVYYVLFNVSSNLAIDAADLVQKNKTILPIIIYRMRYTTCRRCTVYARAVSSTFHTNITST